VEIKVKSNKQQQCPTKFEIFDQEIPLKRNSDSNKSWPKIKNQIHKDK
jgi:hypothetical protein